MSYQRENVDDLLSFIHYKGISSKAEIEFSSKIKDTVTRYMQYIAVYIYIYIKATTFT